MARVRFRRAAVWTVALLFSCAIISWLLFSQEESRLDVELDRLGVDIALEEVDLVQGEQGSLKWKLKADLATYEKDRSLARLVEPRFIFYLHDSNRTVQVMAPMGEVEQADDRVRLWPRVSAEYDDSLVRADRVDYQGAEQQVVFTGNVSLTRPGMRFTGEQARLALDTQIITAAGDVRVVITQESFDEE